MAAMLPSQALHTSALLSADEYIQPRRPVLPHVQAAGDATRENADCTASCLSFDERPQTPDHQKKYRQSVLHEPGKIVRHFGVAEDPLQEGGFGRATIARPGETVADYIKSYPQSSLAHWALQRSEDVYARCVQSLKDLYIDSLCHDTTFITIAVQVDGISCCNCSLSQPEIAQSAIACCSSKREPLGKGYVRGHKIPHGLGTEKPFGVAIHAKVSFLQGAPSPSQSQCTIFYHC